jgi:hypothetical protein
MQVEDILPKLENLRQCLEAEAPNIEQHLMEINNDLRQYPDLTFMLTDEQIAPIYQAILKKENIVIAVKQSKKRGSNSKLDDGRTVADLL